MAALIIAGGALSAYGAVKSNMDKADAERQNANYFAEQADYAQLAGNRELSIFQGRAEQLQGRTIGAYAASGVDISGSPLAVVENQALKRQEEEQAIKLETGRRVRLAQLKRDQSLGQADNYSSFMTNFLSAAPSILGSAGSAYATKEKP